MSAESTVPGAQGSFAVVDGGLSTALESMGHRPSGPLWTASCLVDRPDLIVAAHRSFVEAGAEVIITAAYQASLSGFEQAGCSAQQARSLLGSTTELARSAGAVAVAASCGPFGAVLADGSEYSGVYAQPWGDVRSFHRQRLEVLVDSGPDLIAIETIPSAHEAEIILDELTSLGGPPAWLSMSCATGTTTCAGDDIADAALLASGYDALVAFGVNCVAPAHVGPLLTRAGLSLAGDVALIAYPNHGGTWDSAAGQWHDSEVGDCWELVQRWVDAGARFIGGCCGHGPESISRLVAARHALV